jgi:transposase, IS5 family
MRFTATVEERLYSPQQVRRPSTPVVVVLRMLLTRRLYDCAYTETVRWVADSISLRQFCRVGTHAVPDESTLDRWAGFLTPATLTALNQIVVRHARAAGLTRGRALRLDTTVIETPIHHPSDSALLADGVWPASRYQPARRS